MSIIQLCNLATSLASNSAFLTCHIFTEFCFCVRMQFHFIFPGLHLIISLIGYFSFLLPYTLSLKKQCQIRSFIQSTNWCHTVTLKELSKLQWRLGTSSCREERPGNFKSLWPRHISHGQWQERCSTNPLFFTLGQTLITFFSIYLYLSFLLLCCLDMFETQMKLSLFTEVWEISCTNHFVQLKPHLAFDGPWPHKYPPKNESLAFI